MALSELLSRATGVFILIRPDVAVIKPAGAPWSVFCTPRGTVPPSVTGLRVLERSAGIALPDAGVQVRGRSPVRIRAVAGAAAVIVLVGGGLAVWRVVEPAGDAQRPPGRSGAGELARGMHRLGDC